MRKRLSATESTVATARKASGPSGRRRRTFVAVAMALAVLGGTVMASPVAGQASIIEARIVAQKLEDGRVEFGFQERARGGAWSNITLPQVRFFPTTAGVNSWLASSPVLLGTHARDSWSGDEIRIVARKLTDGRIEFALQHREVGNAWGGIQFPRVRFFPTTAGVNSWLASSVLTPVISSPASGSSGGVPTPPPPPPPPTPEPSGPASTAPYTAVSASDFQSCGLHRDGAITCWGAGAAGHLNAPAGEFSDVSAGNYYICGLSTDDTIACWGAGPAAPDGEFSAVSTGAGHACGVRADGTITCWGDNDNGQTSVPKGEYTAVTAGRIHSCGLRTDGKVTCWGNPWYGQTGPPDVTFVAISAGDRHSCGVRTDGTITCWGNNWYGQREVPTG